METVNVPYQFNFLLHNQLFYWQLLWSTTLESISIQMNCHTLISLSIFYPNFPRFVSLKTPNLNILTLMQSLISLLNILLLCKVS